MNKENTDRSTESTKTTETNPGARLPSAAQADTDAQKNAKTAKEVYGPCACASGEFRFNDVVECLTMRIVMGRPVVGRLVQVRIGTGPCGTDTFFLRMADGSLRTFANDRILHSDAEVPLGPDKPGDRYTIDGEWEYSGFIVGMPEGGAS